jgi:hypothetical protein
VGGGWEKVGHIFEGVVFGNLEAEI